MMHPAQAALSNPSSLFGVRVKVVPIGLLKNRHQGHERPWTDPNGR